MWRWKPAWSNVGFSQRHSRTGSYISTESTINPSDTVFNDTALAGRGAMAAVNASNKPARKAE